MKDTKSALSKQQADKALRGQGEKFKVGTFTEKK